jgi:hypothetical protein
LDFALAQALEVTSGALQAVQNNKTNPTHGYVSKSPGIIRNANIQFNIHMIIPFQMQLFSPCFYFLCGFGVVFLNEESILAVCFLSFCFL